MFTWQKERRGRPIAYDCLICFERFYSKRDRTGHISKNHVSVQEYATIVFPKQKKKGPTKNPFCICGKQKKLISLERGFRIFCSIECRNESRKKKIRDISLDPKHLGNVKILKRYGGSFKDVELSGIVYEKTMGWEFLFLRDLQKFKISPEDVTRDVPKVFWRISKDDRKVRKYTADFFVPRKNLLVEIKSGYTFHADSKEVMRKIRYAQMFGYDVLLLIYQGISDYDPEIREYKGSKRKKEVQDRLRQITRNTAQNKDTLKSEDDIPKVSKFT